MGRALHDEMLRATSAATVKEALREHAARKPTFMERYGITRLLRMLLAAALGIYEFLCGWRDLYSKPEAPSALVAQMLEANKVIRSNHRPSPPQPPPRFPIEQYHSMLTPHHILFSFSLQIEQEAGHDTTKAQRSQGTKEHEPRMGDLQTPERQEQYLDDGAE